MEKDAFYFPHFSNARHDRKIRRLRKEMGIEGYGIFFMLLEVLRDQEDFKYPMEDIDLLCEEFGTSEQKINVVIHSYKLFNIDETEKFFSPKLMDYMQPYLAMKEQRRLAGKKSGEARRLKSGEQNLNDRSTEVKRELDENEQSKVSQVNQVNKINKSQSTEKTEEILTTPEDLLKKHFDIDGQDFSKFKTKGMTDQVIIGVLNLCKIHGAKSWTYIEKALDEKLSLGILTTDDWEKKQNTIKNKDRVTKESTCPYRYED